LVKDLIPNCITALFLKDFTFSEVWKCDLVQDTPEANICQQERVEHFPWQPRKNAGHLKNI